MPFNEKQELERWRKELKSDLENLYAKKNQAATYGFDEELDGRIASAQYRLSIIENRINWVE